MEFVSAIILLLSTITPLIVTTITFIAKFTKSSKGKTAAENLIMITEAIEEFMIKAEQVSGYSGEQKKSFVLNAVHGLVTRNNIEFDEMAAGEIIEKLILFSRGVNKNDKEK